MVISTVPAKAASNSSVRRTRAPAASNGGSEEVKRRLNEKLKREIDANPRLGALVIQLRAPRDVSPKEIATKAMTVKDNVFIARDWLDEATRDRFVVQFN